MRIGLSAYLLHQGHDYRAAGVSLYTHNLLRSLPLIESGHRFIAFQGRDAPLSPGIEHAITGISTNRPLARIAWEQTGMPASALRRRIDVLHGTVNVLPLAFPGRMVVTVHDLSFLRMPETLPVAKVRYLRSAVSLSCRRAAHIIAVSASTKNDVVELLRVPIDRVTVVHSGVDSHFAPMIAAECERFRAKHFHGRPYILHVGTLQPRKNIDVLIRAFATARAQVDLPHMLVLVGARGWMYKSLFELVAQRGLQSHVVFADYVPPEDLPLWYNASDLFAYPSAYEGFGLPVLEAMACGVPVITSASSSLTEVAGDAGISVPPGSEEALRMAIVRVLADSELHSGMISRGLARASIFTWARTAAETLAVYESVAQGTAK